MSSEAGGASSDNFAFCGLYFAQAGVVAGRNDIEQTGQKRRLGLLRVEGGTELQHGRCRRRLGVVGKFLPLGSEMAPDEHCIRISATPQLRLLSIILTLN